MGKFVSGTAAVPSPSPPQKDERAGARRSIVSNSNPLAPTLSSLGRGEGEENISLVRIIGVPTTLAGEEIPIPMMGERDEV
jgi:hypothetical protein